MYTDKKKSLQVLAFFDNRPGHKKQTQGILRELQNIVDVHVDEVTIPLQSSWREAWDWVRYFLGRGRCAVQEDSSYDLILGTGSRTHIPMLTCSQQMAARVVTCMAPTWILRSRFDLCCVPHHDGIAARENILTTIGPPNSAVESGQHSDQQGLILLGGIDIKSHRWSDGDIAGCVQDIVKREQAVNWVISSSPRTPQSMVAAMEEVDRDHANASFFRFEETPPGWVEEHYASSRVVWVTADSISMVYEALSAGCCVGILPVEWKKEKNKFKTSGDYLLENGLAVPFASWKQGKAKFTSKSDPLNEAKRCAEEIVNRWYQKS